jgi:arabinofuranosyltransferase
VARREGTAASARSGGASKTRRDGRAEGSAGALASLLDVRAPFVVPLILLIASRLTAWASLSIASEDAYITFRYARNLASGFGLVFNQGDRVMGFTSPLWAVWNALGIRIGMDPVLWSRATSLAADIVTLILVIELLRRSASTAAAWAFGFFFAAWPYFSAVSVSGMENSTMVTLVVLSAWLAERRSLLSGPVLAALALVRPEGFVVAILLAVWAGWRDRIVAATLVGAALVALTLYYGSAIPQSLLAKSQIYGTPGPWAGRHWWEWFLPMALGRWPLTGEGTMLMPLAVVMAPAAVVGVVHLWRARTTALARAVAGLLCVWFGYAILGVAYFYWYLVVPLAGIVIAAAVGWPQVVRGRSIAIASVLFVLGTWSISRVLYIGRTQNEYFSFGGVVSQLSGKVQAGQKVMLEPIGLIGYSLPLTVIDEVGLVSPEVARRRLEGPGWYTDIATRERPDWLVIRKSVLEQDGAFAGRGAPFRSPAERDSLFARYQRDFNSDPGRGDMEVWRRTR